MRLLHLTTISVLALSLSACAGMSEKLSRINRPPPQSFSDPGNIPMPAPQSDIRNANSLWATSRQTFFKDQRARQVGDILTVLVSIEDSAELDNETIRERDSSESANVATLLGLEGYIGKVLPSGVNPANLADFGSTTNTNGKGEVDREEKIDMKLAAIVADILPNGNMVVKGTQEVRVNNENRILTLSGVIRPEDITIANTIGYDKVAEARISYGGLGQITDVQQPRYGQQVFEAISPF